MPKLNPTSYGGYEVPDYIYNNFNDIANAFVTLFELLVVNNWCVNVKILFIINTENIKYKSNFNIFLLLLIRHRLHVQ